MIDINWKKVYNIAGNLETLIQKRRLGIMKKASYHRLYSFIEKFAEKNNGGGKGYAHCNLQRCHAARQCAVYKPCGKSLQPSYRAIGFRICRFISVDKSCQEQDQCGQDSPLQGISRPVFSDCRIAFHIWFPLIPIGSQILLLCLSFFYYLSVVLHHIFLPFFRVSRVCDSIRDAVRVRVGDK